MGLFNCCFKTEDKDSADDGSKPLPKAAAGGKGAPAQKKITHVGTILKREVEELNSVYTLGKELGRGCFGVTRLAINKETGAVHACKSISKTRTLKTKEDSEDVRREVSIMYHLQGHPNVVNLFGTYEDKANVHLVMECCEGGELFDRIVEKGHYKEKDAADIFRTIMKVVAQCHALGVMHRDLKPENFLLSTKKDDALLKATDFGLSIFFKPGERFGDIVGSAYYVAPEVLKRNYGPEADVWSAGVILYILLCGVPPFWAESEQGIFQAVLKGKYDITNSPWHKISKSAKELVQALLKANPRERMTAAEALSHPWVREGGEASDVPLDDSVMIRLKKFSEMNRLKKMALQVIAKNMSAQEIEGLSELFKAFDKDNSGSITLAELEDGLSKMAKQGGASLTESQVKALMESADVDGDGTISYEEFIASTLHMNKLDSDENLWKAFASFDTDDSGYITHEELSDALLKHGMPIENIEQIIKDVDKDNDGRINYDEFVQMMRSNNPSGTGINLGDLSLSVEE
ncbi:calcium-dependent protein kinase [Cymbomonas tetramitiformis]|uniref:Calcium-dependent protein kinase n=1 Tax=Cymbomonas tetramitiformis TaxID=36881 RepID=A0AAE0GD10_9CHLO|nr:calcium-dependent protein kinase [Cymbomonas tetramitiformis]